MPAFTMGSTQKGFKVKDTAEMTPGPGAYSPPVRTNDLARTNIGFGFGSDIKMKKKTAT